MKENNEARRLFLQQSFGVLSTISLDVPGYPFGSITPYCADRQCRPVIYISSIAQHTQNILADPRVSLTVLENADSGDVQARGRLTCIANARPLSPDEDDVRERYFRYFPRSESTQGRTTSNFSALISSACASSADSAGSTGLNRMSSSCRIRSPRRRKRESSST